MTKSPKRLPKKEKKIEHATEKERDRESVSGVTHIQQIREL